MENNIIQKSNRGKTILLDSDYRAGAIMYIFTASLLTAFAVVNAILWYQVSQKPSQAVSREGALTLFGFSILLSIIGGIFFIYAFYKLIVAQEQRDKIAKAFYSWASKPSGSIKPADSDKLEPSDLKNINIESEPQNRDLFSTTQIAKKEPTDAGIGDVSRQLDLEGF